MITAVPGKGKKGNMKIRFVGSEEKGAAIVVEEDKGRVLGGKGA